MSAQMINPQILQFYYAQLLQKILNIYNAVITETKVMLYEQAEDN